MACLTILSVDEGTTNSKAVLVGDDGNVLSSGSCPVAIDHPRPGWVEQDANEIWSSTVSAIAVCIRGGPEIEIAAIGVSNQRESVLAWNRKTGEPLGPAITWQCRRTAPVCEALRNAGHEARVIAKTGLPLDPLFPATKIRWLLENHCRSAASGDICIGTVDSWLIWKFTGGNSHSTDASNAARTQLFNLTTGKWDDGLCGLFGIDPALLPAVRDSSFKFGVTSEVEGLPDGIPISSAIGDSHAALFSHGAFNTGDCKVTLGTGSSVMTTIQEFIVPPNGITTTIAWQLNGKPAYSFEGNILVSASVLPWTAELLGLEGVDSLLELAQSVDGALGVNLVPAHVGLGSPHWNPEARALIDGLTFSAKPPHIAHASVLSIILQICDVFDIIKASIPSGISNLSVDGGPSRNAFMMQKLADFLDHPVTTRERAEASAIGAAYLAGLEAGIWQGLDEIAGLIQQGRVMEPNLGETDRSVVRENWSRAIARSTLGT